MAFWRRRKKKDPPENSAPAKPQKPKKRQRKPEEKVVAEATGVAPAAAPRKQRQESKPAKRRTSKRGAPTPLEVKLLAIEAREAGLSAGLDLHREGPVRLAAGLGHHPLHHLELQHHRHRSEGLGTSNQLHDDGGTHVVGQVGHDLPAAARRHFVPVHLRRVPSIKRTSGNRSRT